MPHCEAAKVRRHQHHHHRRRPAALSLVNLLPLDHHFSFLGLEQYFGNLNITFYFPLLFHYSFLLHGYYLRIAMIRYEYMILFLITQRMMRGEGKYTELDLKMTHFFPTRKMSKI